MKKSLVVLLLFLLAGICSASAAQDLLHAWNITGKKHLLETKIQGKGVRFIYHGKTEDPVRAVMVQNVNVTPGKYLRLDYRFFKHRWNHASHVRVSVEFLRGKHGNGSFFIDRSNLNPYRPMDFTELVSPSGIGLDLDYFNYIRVPAKSTAVRLSVQFSGNPCELELKSWTVQEVPGKKQPWYSQPAKGEQLVFEKSPAVTDEQALEILKKRPKSVSSLVLNKDRVEWFVNGKKITPAIFHNLSIGNVSHITKYHPAGFKLFTSAVMLGRSGYKHHMPPVWKEDGSLDIKVMEEAVLRIVREAPDAYVVLNLIVTPTKKWLMENRSELRLLADGTPGILRGFHFQNIGSKTFPTQPGDTWSPSLHSRKYVRDVSAVLEKIMREFEKTPAANAVAGVYITGGDDIQFRAPREADHSPLARPAFQDFLRKKYGNEKAMAKVWGKNAVSFSSVTIPSKQELACQGKSLFGVRASRESDYMEFLSDECAAMKTAFRQAVKRGAPRLLVGGYDNAMSLVGSTLFGVGRYAMHRIITDPGCDFIISLPSYGRERDECTLPMGLKAFTGSMRLHKKLIVSEMDIRNPEQPPLQGWNKSRNWQASHNNWTFREFLALYCGYAAAWGGAFHAFPLAGKNFYNTPQALEAWQRGVMIADSAAGEVLDDNRIAWVNNDSYSNYFPISPEGHFLASSFNQNIYSSLWTSQIRFDAYLPEDLFHPDFKAPKILLLGDVTAMKPEMIAKIRKRFLKEGRVLIWLGAPGLFSGASDKAISDAIGFKLIRPAEIRNRSIFIDRELDPLLKGVSGYLYPVRMYSRHPRFFHTAAVVEPGMTVLGYYQNTRIPGAVMRKTAAGTEIFIGQQGAVTPQLLTNIARSVGIFPATDGKDLLIKGGGLIVLGASRGNGIRKVFYPPHVKSLKCLTGQKILKQTDRYCEVYLKYGECAVFSLQ